MSDNIFKTQICDKCKKETEETFAREFFCMTSAVEFLCINCYSKVIEDEKKKEEIIETKNNKDIE